MAGHKGDAEGDTNEREVAERALLVCIRNPFRRRLLRIYVESGDTLSPKELTDLTKRPHLLNVSYHVRVLAQYGAVELVETRPVRGSIEHFYRAASLVDDVPWGRAALGLEDRA